MSEETLQAEHELANLSSIILKEIPNQQELRELIIPDPQPEVVPINFDGLLELKNVLKSQQVRIPRAEGWDKDGIKSGNDIREEYRTVRKERQATNFDNTTFILSKREDPDTFSSQDGTVFIAEDEFPYHVNQAGDAIHFDVWVTGEIESAVPAEKVAETIARFLQSKKLGANDFVLIQNPPPNKTVPEVEHLHLFTRVKE